MLVAEGTAAVGVKLVPVTRAPDAEGGRGGIDEG